MQRLIILILTILMCIGCSCPKQIPVETIINYKDSTLIHMVDSIRYIPKERIVDVVPVYDSLTLETNIAKAKAWVDTTTHTLKGSLENKKGIEYKYIYKDRVEYRDSIVTKEVPVEVTKEVKTHYSYEKWLWMISILSLLYFTVRIYVRFKGSIFKV